MGDYYDDDDEVGGIGADMDEIEDSIDESEVESEVSEDELEKDIDEDDDVIPPSDTVDIEEVKVEVEKHGFAMPTLDNRDDNHRTVMIVPPEERITSDIIQLPEMTEAIGIRISQIENGMQVMPGVNVEGMTSAIEMAQKEFLENKNPLILRRIIQQRGNIVIAEDWEVCKMAHPPRARFYLAAIKKHEPPVEVGSVPPEIPTPLPVPKAVRKKVAAKTKTVS